MIWLFYNDQFNLINALLYALGFIAASVFYTWLYLHTGGSILIASLFHATYDTVAMIASGLPGNLFSFRIHMLVWIIMAVGLTIVNRWIKKQDKIAPPISKALE